MFLQLLMVALAIFALLRPGWQGTRLVGERIIFVIDNSASMSADDVEGAPSRLALTKEKVAGLVDQIRSGMSAMIIAFADSPQVVQEFTDNQNLLKERLATIEPTAQSTDILDALKLAGGLANPAQMTLQDESGVDVEVTEAVDTSLYIFSDGRFADVAGFDLGELNPVYIPVGDNRRRQPGDHRLQHAAGRGPARGAAGVCAGDQPDRRAARVRGGGQARRAVPGRQERRGARRGIHSDHTSRWPTPRPAS